MSYSSVYGRFASGLALGDTSMAVYIQAFITGNDEPNEGATSPVFLFVNKETGEATKAI